MIIIIYVYMLQKLLSFDSEWYIYNIIIVKNFNGNYLAYLFFGIWVFIRLVLVFCIYISNKVNIKINFLNFLKWSI